MQYPHVNYGEDTASATVQPAAGSRARL